MDVPGFKKDDINIENLLKSIYDDKKFIEYEKQKIDQNSKEIRNLKEKLNKDLSFVEEQERNIINEAKSKARDILLNAKDDANSIIKDIENSKNNKVANNLRNKLNDKINNLSTVNSSFNKLKSLEKSEITLGMTVFIPTLNQVGIVISLPSKSNKVQIQVGSLKMNFDIDKLEKTNKQINNIEKEHSKKRDFKVKSFSTELNVIGLNVEEACFEIDKYLDSAIMNGLNSVRIIHGKGTGILRKGIHNFLKNHPHVKDYRIGTYGEGENGVTIINLK